MNLRYLTNEIIDSTADAAVKFLSDNNTEKQSVTAIRLSLEEVLMHYQNAFGTDTSIDFECTKRLGRLTITLEIPGESSDPFAGIDESGQFVHDTMIRMGTAPEWIYKKDTNVITFNYKKKRKISSAFFVIAAIVFGIIFGILSRHYLGETGVMISEVFLAPVSSTILGLLSTLSAFLIFVSVVNGIFGMRDMTTFSRVGKRMLGEFVLVLFAFAVVLLVSALLVFPLTTGGRIVIDFAGIWNIILAIIPINIPQAFSTCNALQIIFLSIASGIILLSISSKVQSVALWIEQVDLFIQTAIEYIVRFMPIVVFISIYNTIVTGTVDEFVQVYKYIVLIFVACFIALAYFIIKTCVTQKVRPHILIRKLLPIFSIALATGSTTSTFSTCLNVAENKLGIDKQIVNIGVPISQTLLKVGGEIIYVYAVFTLADLYDIPMSVATVATLFFSVPILTAATPSVPGGSLSCLALLCGQVGIPTEALAIIVAFDFIADRICTATQVTVQPNILIKIASNLDLIDKEKIRKA